MTSVGSSRLLALHQRYSSSSEEPTGAAFYRAFRRHLKANRESLLDITMTVTAAHLTLAAGPDGVDPLLLKAIHDTNPSLSETSLFGWSDEAQQGAVNAAKGKYFEYLVVERLNNGEQVGPLVLPDGFHAELATSFTQPGWDLRIVDSQGVVNEYLQLKATDSVGYVHEALERYPDFQILATHDVASSGLVLDSGLSNADLSAHVTNAVDVVDASVLDHFLDYFSPLIPLMAVASLEGYKLVVGRQSFDAFKVAFARRGQRVVVAKLAGAVVYALDGGLLSVPTAFAAGLWFDHTVNQEAIATAFSARRKTLLALRLQQQNRLLQGALQ